MILNFYKQYSFRKNIVLSTVMAIVHTFFVSPLLMAATPDDYAYGAELLLTEKSPFYRIELPPTLYLESTQPNLADVQVFNKNTQQPLPFTFVNHSNEVMTKGVTAKARFFIMQRNSDQSSTSNIVLRSSEGVEVRMNMPPSSELNKSIIATYLIDASLIENLDRPVTQLKFRWKKPYNDWQVIANVYGGANPNALHQLVARDVPLMSLSSGQEQLELDSIPLHADDKHKYWLLVLKADNNMAVPNIDTIEVMTDDTKQIYRELLALTMNFDGYLSIDEDQKNSQKNKKDEQLAIYSLPSPQPVKFISISPKQVNSILPVEILVRNKTNEHWQYLGKMIASNIQENKDTLVNKFIVKEGLSISQVALRPVNTSWNIPPVVTAYQNKKLLIFNAAGEPPFILAWGAYQQTKSNALDYNELFSSYPISDINQLPSASIGTSFTINKENIVKPNNTEQDNKQWQKIVLWIVLLSGVVGLFYFALVLWREFNSKNEDNN